jgi:hypothetical protein
MEETDFDFVAARAALDTLKAALKAFEPIAKRMDEGDVAKHFAEVARSEAQSLGVNLMFASGLADAVERIGFMVTGLTNELEVERLAPPIEPIPN